MEFIPIRSGNNLWEANQTVLARPPLPQLEDATVKIHLGCGSIDHPDFINIDGLPAPHVHYIRAIDNLTLFKDNSVDLVYASHCLEHFPHHQISKVLAEWFRVLKQGGILRLSVPDFDLLLKIYQENNNDLNTILTSLMGVQNYKFNFHMTVFNQSTLDTFLKSTGFRKIREWSPDSSELKKFQDCASLKLQVNGKDYPVSLNLEAVK
jgi:predicted SAM-dependent methyltransferase